MTIDISEAIQSLNTKGDNTYEYVITGTPTSEAEYKSLVQFVESKDANGNAVFSSTQPYTWSQVSTEQAALQTTYNSLAYARTRAKSYPSIQDQLDMQYHDTVDGTTTWKDAITQVKTDIPKP